MERLIAELRRDRRIGPCVIHQGVSPAAEPSFREPRSGWPPGGRACAEALGARKLFSHQADVLDCAARGQSCVVATPTASGKTLAYLLAFLARRQQDPDARGLFLYPLKALARDQLSAIRAFLGPAGLNLSAAADVYDGDTPETARRRIRRQPPAALLTNPDMLHMGLLPHHDAWSSFLRGLRLIVIDEAHVYRGIFGAHVHHVLRRLLRLARHYGGDPIVVAGSATIGAPGELVQTLTGEPVEVIDRSGAPTSPRQVLMLEPETVSPYTVATQVVARCVEAGHKTIAFTKARRITELMHRWLVQGFPELASRVTSYRAGYLPEERRDIESRLFQGQLDGVISTSALEAGIDVGGLDVCVLVGYPGSLATAWQRIGRAGRGSRDSLAVLVALPDALDRYVVHHPEHFFSGAFERVALDPHNDVIADAHLGAAAAEMSLGVEDLLALDGEAAVLRAQRLEAEGKLLRAHEEERWISLRRRPQREIPLRSAGQPYRLVRVSDGRLLGTLDEIRAWHEGHPGAIYLHAGQTYRVTELDRDEREIRLERFEADYYTQVYARKETEILERCDERELGPAKLAWGRLRVTTIIEGYGRRKLFGGEEISRHPLEAPEQVLETIGFWFEGPGELIPMLVARDHHPAGSLHAAEHAAIGLFPLQAICDRWDLGGISYARHPQMERPAVFVYDGWPGGVGLARDGYARAEELFERTLELLRSCPCEDGCPACIHSPKCGSGNHPLDKAGAALVFEVLLGERELEEADVTQEEVRKALASHRRVLHPGVRGGADEGEGAFQSGEAGAAAVKPVAAEAEDQAPGDLERVVPLNGVHWPWDLARPEGLLAPSEGRWLFFDLETLRSADDVGGWQNIRDMGLALGVVFDSVSGELRTYLEEDADRLAEDLLAADRVVGFNSDRFDLTVLEGYVGKQIRAVNSLDLLVEVRGKLGKRLSLSHLVQQTLGAGKSADGLQSLRWVKQGRFDLIERYCRDDVVLTTALWAHGRERGYVLFKTKDGIRARVPVQW